MRFARNNDKNAFSAIVPILYLLQFSDDNGEASGSGSGNEMGGSERRHSSISCSLVQCVSRDERFQTASSLGKW